MSICAPLLLAICLSTFKEADWVEATCESQVEYRLPNRLRVDCLTDHVAYEYDWGHKWAEGIGQALAYGLLTGKEPGLRLIERSRSDTRGISHAKEIVKLLAEKYDITIKLEVIP